jgi:hypothetical protein
MAQPLPTLYELVYLEAMSPRIGDVATVATGTIATIAKIFLLRILAHRQRDPVPYSPRPILHCLVISMTRFARPLNHRHELNTTFFGFLFRVSGTDSCFTVTATLDAFGPCT